MSHGILNLNLKIRNKRVDEFYKLIKNNYIDGGKLLGAGGGGYFMLIAKK